MNRTDQRGVRGQVLADMLRPWHPTGSSKPEEFTHIGIREIRSGRSSTAPSIPAVVVAVVARRHRIRLRRRLCRLGLSSVGRVLLIPRWPDSEHLLSIGPALPDGIERHLGSSAPVTVLRWLVSRSWGRSIVALLAPSVGTIATADPTANEHHWLLPHVEGTIIAHSSRRPRHDAPTQLALLYRRCATTPVAVGKLASEASGVERIERERRALVGIGRSASDADIVVPKLLGHGPDHLVMSAIAGRPLDRLLRQEGGRLDSTAVDVLEALGRWQIETATIEQFDSGIASELFSNRLDSLRSAHPELSPSADAIDAAVLGLLGRPITTVACHGDLTAANVVRSADGSIGFLDWESATSGGLATTDDWYFAVDAIAVERGCSHADAVEFALTSADPLAIQLVERIRRTVSAIGASDEHAKLAFYATWIGHAHNELARGTVRGKFVAVLRRLDELAPEGDLISIPRASPVDANDHRTTNEPTQR